MKLMCSRFNLLPVNVMMVTNIDSFKMELDIHGGKIHQQLLTVVTEGNLYIHRQQIYVHWKHRLCRVDMEWIGTELKQCCSHIEAAPPPQPWSLQVPCFPAQASNLTRRKLLCGHAISHRIPTGVNRNYMDSGNFSVSSTQSYYGELIYFSENVCIVRAFWLVIHTVFCQRIGQ